jgi:hypothetical protein
VGTSTDEPDSRIRGCRDGCACPTCLGHNPNTCSIDSETLIRGSCVAYSPQSDLPPNTALSIYNDNGSVVDAWIKHMENPLPSLESTSPSDVEASNGSPLSLPYSEPRQLSSSARGGDIGFRSVDDLPAMFVDKELASLDPTFFSFSSECPPSLHFSNISASILDSMLGMDSLSAEFVDVLHRSRSASTSTSELSFSDSDASESSVMSRDVALFYQHAGAGTSSGRTYSSYAACSSTSSLPDTSGYF